MYVWTIKCSYTNYVILTCNNQTYVTISESLFGQVDSKPHRVDKF